MRFTLSTLAQPYIFAVFVYTGILLGVVYTLFKLIKKAFGRRCIPDTICNIIFMLFSGALVTYVMYRTVNLRLRFYYVYGLAAGFGLYIAAIFPLARAVRQKLTKKNVDKRSKNDCNNI